MEEKKEVQIIKCLGKDYDELALETLIVENSATIQELKMEIKYLNGCCDTFERECGRLRTELVERNEIIRILKEAIDRIKLTQKFLYEAEQREKGLTI